MTQQEQNKEKIMTMPPRHMEIVTGPLESQRKNKTKQNHKVGGREK